MRTYEIKYNLETEVYELEEDGIVIVEEIDIDNVEEIVEDIANEENLEEIDYKIIYNL